MKREESEEATLPRGAQGQQEALAENKGEYNAAAMAAARETSTSSRQNEITGSKRINPGRAKTQGE